MVSSKQTQLKYIGRMCSPWLQFLGSYTLVVHAAECRDRTAKGRFWSMHIGITQREIRAERGENELHHFRMFEHFPRGPVEPAHTIEEFIFRQIVERIRVGNLRRRTARHKKMHGFDAVAASYLPREFECDQAADAVPEQRDRPIETRL